MLLLIGVILLGTIIMINLIVAIIITDIERLSRICKQQVLRNQVCGVTGTLVLVFVCLALFDFSSLLHCRLTTQCKQKL